MPDSPVKEFMILIFIIALIFGIYASKSYDNDSFLGIKQVKLHFKRDIDCYKPYGDLSRAGALKFVRHPYYFSGIVLLWSRPMFVKDLILNIIFTLYFIAGSFNEERKLQKIYGSEYEEYKRNVPMIIPKFVNPLYFWKIKFGCRK